MGVNPTSRLFTSVLLVLGALFARPETASAQFVQPTTPPWRWLWIGGNNPNDTWGSGNSQNAGALTGNFLLFPNNVPNPPLFRPHTGSDLVVIDLGQSSTGVLGETITGTADCRIEQNGAWTIGRLEMGANTTLSLVTNSSLRISKTPEIGYPAFAAAGTVVCDGDIRLDGTASAFTDLWTTESTGLPITGSGFITMNGSPMNRIYSGGGGPLTSTVTIRGGGTIGQGFSRIDNNNVIEATLAAGSLRIWGGIPLKNSGVLRARAGGTLELPTSQTGATECDNSSGIIEAADASIVRLFAARVTGGRLTSSGTGTIRPAAEFSSKPIFVNVRNEAAIVVDPGMAMALEGTFTNAGTVTITAPTSGAFTDLLLRADATIFGPNPIVFNNDSLQGRLRTDTDAGIPPATLTIAADAELRGAHKLGNNSLQIVNNGLINATGQTNAIFIETTPALPMTNNGILRASGPGGVFVNGGVINNANGTINAQDGSTVTLANFANLNGGSFSSSGTGAMRFVNNPTIANLVNNGRILVEDSGVQAFGVIANRATFQLRSTSTFSDLDFSADAVLSGPNPIVMSGPTNNRIGVLGTTARLTIAADGGITGTGSMGASSGSLRMTNNGTITADGAGNLYIRAGGGTGDVVNNGMFRAINGGTMTLDGVGAGSSSYRNDSGIFEAQNASTIVRTVSNAFLSYDNANGTLLGTYRTFGTGRIILNLPVANRRNAGSLYLTGAGGDIDAFAGLTSNTGAIRLADGAKQSIGGNFSNSGAIELAHGASGVSSVLTVSGNFSQGAQGSLKVEVGLASQHHLAVTGVATLGGTLVITPIAGFQFRVGDAYAVVTAGSVTGSFSSVSLPAGVQGTLSTAGGTVTLTITSAPATTSLGNISTRGRVETGDNVMIGGFIIAGTTNKRVIVRAKGPSLTAFGVAGALSNPTLTLYDPQGQPMATNDDWRATQEAEITASTLAPTDNRESAIIATLAPGPYTAIVRGVGGEMGVGIVEVYDLDPGTIETSRPINVSTRGRVLTADGVMIGGFILEGTRERRVIIRAIGPSLTPFGVQGALADPTLTLYDPQGQPMLTNDNWKSTQEAEIVATGHAPSSDLESAIVVTLNPGPYTAIVRGTDGTTGVGLVEIFDLE